ncbi:hypothetical protein PR202_ga00165 [Eleusine coracana subsp. coracana]|uniref:Protein TIFY n=1 Tax=Eleusine coracana subsp. coracana TaxID=191504 RepID=A0AAV5BGR6_ELECO|nr:hypothetical protein QOZ80_2AG0123620 [Eleusine coracana subsp. coracana]GJM84489.1 hypothetical protein PR202_ga00165 [Eleusine coracana subsp. coracana]
MATTAGSIKSRAGFASACGVLSQYVKAAAVMEADARSPTMVALPLMPGADVSTTTQEEQEPASCASKAQMTIFYGGQVVVLDAVPADRAAELLQFAAAGKKAELPVAGDDLLPIARKASLQRFMEKRRVRVAARATSYSRPDGGDACPDRLTLKL